MLWLGLLLLFPCPPQSPPTAHPAPPEPKPFEQRLGELPARFNGRLQTLDEIARQLLQVACGAPVRPGPDAEAPVVTLIDHLAGLPVAAERPMFLVEDPAFADELDLGEPLADGTWRLSLRDLQWRSVDIDDALQDPEFEAAARALSGPAYRWLDAKQMVMPVPLDPERHRWGLLSEDVQPTPPGRAAFLELLDAIVGFSGGDPLVALDAYSTWLEARLPEKPALEFDVPAGWQASGSFLEPRRWFTDAGEMGLRVASFEATGATPGYGGIVHFSDAFDVRRAIDSWLLGQRQLPLDHDAESATPLDQMGTGIPGAASAAVDAFGQEGPEASVNLGCAFCGPAGGWIVTLATTRAELADHRAEFLAFVRSIRVGPPAAVRGWLPPRPVDASSAPEARERLELAVFAAHDCTWVLDVHGLDSGAAGADAVASLVAALEWDDADGSGWSCGDPTWSSRGTSPTTAVFLWPTAEDPHATAVLQAYAPAAPAGRRHLVDAVLRRWGARPLTQSEWAAASRVPHEVGELLRITRGLADGD